MLWRKPLWPNLKRRKPELRQVMVKTRRWIRYALEKERTVRWLVRSRGSWGWEGRKGEELGQTGWKVVISPTSEIEEEQKQHKVESFGLGCQQSCAQPGIYCEDQVRQRDLEVINIHDRRVLNYCVLSMCTYFGKHFIHSSKPHEQKVILMLWIVTQVTELNGICPRLKS